MFYRKNRNVGSDLWEDRMRTKKDLTRVCHYCCAEEPLKRLVDWYSPVARRLPYPTMEIIVMITHMRKFFTTACLLAMLAVTTCELRPLPGAGCVLPSS